MIPKEALFSKIEPYLVPAIMALVGVGAFGLGRLSAGQGAQAQLRVLYPEAQLATPVSAAEVGKRAPAATASEGQYVASKNGTKYYLTSCSGAGRIKQENKVYFVSAEAARAAGYEPAANCPGL